MLSRNYRCFMKNLICSVVKLTGEFGHLLIFWVRREYII